MHSETSTLGVKKIDLNKFIIILIGFLDILAIGIFIPTLPDLVNYYGVSAHLISYAIVAYAFFSFLSGPVLGQLSDVFGRKKILILCIAGSVASNLLMTLTSSFAIFIFARIINGITGGNISIISSMMSDISSSKKERMANMGMIGALFGVAFIIGPALGAMLLPFGVKAPFWFMTIVSIFELIAMIILLKETNLNIMKKKINYNPFTSIFKYLKDVNVRIFIVSLFTLILSFSLYQGMFPVFLAKEFLLPAYVTGYIMSAMGLIIAFNQAFLLKRFWFKFFSLSKLFFIINIGIFILFILLFFIKDLTTFLIVFFFLVALQGVVNPIYQSEIVENTSEHERGEVMGVMGSLQAMSMFIGPLIGGICIDKNISIFGFGAIIVFVNILIITRLVKKLKN